MLGALLGAGILFGGCSSSDAVPPAQGGQPVTPTTGRTGAAASATGATPSRGIGAAMPPAGGGQEAPPVAGSLSGEIASVGGASMQLRSGAAPTKVTWTAGTIFQTARVGGTNTTKKGDCVVATRGAKVPGGGPAGDQVTAVVVSDPIGGVCPDSGGPSSTARVVSGRVTATKGTTITMRIKGIGRPTATVNLVLAKNVGVAKAGAGSAKDLVKGRCADVSGMRQASGALVATTITISKPGSSGCPA